MTAANEKNRIFFERVLEKNNLGHAYLFEGPHGSGKLAFALQLAQSLFCEQEHAPLESCGHCYQCRRIEEGQHPDLIYIKADDTSIKVDAIRSLIQRLSQTAMEDQGQMVIIDQAEKMTASAANALLKLLEEPQDDSLLLLLSTSKSQILPTIQSRCQLVHFQALPIEERYQQIQTLVADEKLSLLLAYLTQDQEQAQEWAADEEFLEAVNKLERFYRYIQEESDRAYPYIQKELVSYSNRQQQSQALNILLAFFRIDLKKSIQAGENDGNLKLYRLSHQLESLLQAIKMFQSYVSFQSVLEYFYLCCAGVD